MLTAVRTMRPSARRPPESHGSASASVPGGDDNGIGMVEVLITIVITSIIGAMISGFFLTTVAATRQADGRNEESAAARVTLQSWSVLLRLAVDPLGSTAPGSDRIFSADPTAIRFCAALDTKVDDPGALTSAIGVRLALESGKLVEYRWTSCATMRLGSLTTYQVKRVLTERAILVPGQWLVTPLDQSDTPDGTTLNGELLASDLVIGTAPMTPENRLRTASLQLAFQSSSDPRRPTSATTYSTLVTLTTGS